MKMLLRPLPCGGRLELRPKKKYASLAVDIFRTEYEFSAAGGQKVGEALKAALLTFYRRGGRGGSCGTPGEQGGGTFVYINRIFIDQLEPLAAEIERILGDPANLQPVRMDYRGTRT